MASPFRTNYSRSIVAPKIPRTRYIGLAVLIIAAIVLMAVVFVTIHNRFGSPQSLIDWGTNSIKEVRTWQIPWPAV